MSTCMNTVLECEWCNAQFRQVLVAEDTSHAQDTTTHAGHADR
jgi:hypothetical protein